MTHGWHPGQSYGPPQYAPPNYGFPAYGYPVLPPPAVDSNWIGTTGQICSIVGISSGLLGFSAITNLNPVEQTQVEGLILLSGFLLCALSLLGAILGIVGLMRARRGRATNRGTAISAIVVGLLGLMPLALYITVFFLVLLTFA